MTSGKGDLGLRGNDEREGDLGLRGNDEREGTSAFVGMTSGG